MSDNPQRPMAEEDDLRRKLMRRVAFAGLLIALLLAALAFIDHLGQPSDEAASAGPTFTAPVPVARKEVSQPVKAAEPVTPEPVGKAIEPAPAESSASVPTAQPLPAAAAETPSRPEVAAQPALSPVPARAVSRPPPVGTSRTRQPEAETPAEGTAAVSSQLPPLPERTTEVPRPAVVPAPPAALPLPLPSRLFSGFAVQAGVFADAQHAEELRAKLTLNGIPSTLEARVQVGPFKTREEAEAARLKLKALGVDGILLPPKGARR